MMRLYMEDQGAVAVVGAAQAKKPAAIGISLGISLNVFDPLDVLGCTVGRVFAGAQGYPSSTQVNPLDAHSIYFYLPTFHERLRACMAEVGLGVVP
jgi:hypothetical protein